MTAHHAGGILSAYVAKWLVEPAGWRAAFSVCVPRCCSSPSWRRSCPSR